MSDLRSSECRKELDERKAEQRKKYNNSVQVMATKMMSKWSMHIKKREVSMSTNTGPLTQTKTSK